MGLYDDLAVRGRHCELVLGLIVEGIPYAFVERTLPASFPILTGRALNTFSGFAFAALAPPG